MKKKFWFRVQIRSRPDPWETVAIVRDSKAALGLVKGYASITPLEARAFRRGETEVFDFERLKKLSEEEEG